MSSAPVHPYVRSSAISRRLVLVLLIVGVVAAAIGLTIGLCTPPGRTVNARMLVTHMPPSSTLTEKELMLQLDAEEDDIEVLDQVVAGLRQSLGEVNDRAKTSAATKAVVALMASPQLLRRTVDAAAAEIPDFAERTRVAMGAWGWMSSALRPIGVATGFVDEASELDRTLRIWQRRIEVMRAPESQAIKIAVRCRDPELGMRFTKTLLTTYIEMHVASYSQTDVIPTLEVYADELEARLSAAERALSAFRQEHGVGDVSEAIGVLVDHQLAAGNRLRRVVTERAICEAEIAELSAELDGLPPGSGDRFALAAEIRRHATEMLELAEAHRVAWIDDGPASVAQLDGWVRELRTALAEHPPLGVRAAAASGGPSVLTGRLRSERLRARALALEHELRKAELRRIEAEQQRLEQLSPVDAALWREHAVALAESEVVRIDLRRARNQRKLDGGMVSNVRVQQWPLLEAGFGTVAGMPRLPGMALSAAVLALFLVGGFMLLRASVREELLLMPQAGGGGPPSRRGLLDRLGFEHWGVLLALLVVVTPTLFSRESILAPPGIRDNFAKGIEALSLGLLLVWMVRSRWLPRFNLPLALGSLFVVWSVASGLWVVHQDGFTDQLKKLLHVYAAMLALYLGIKTRRDLEFVMLIWKLASFGYAAIILLELVVPGWRWAGRLVGGQIEASAGVLLMGEDWEHKYRAAGPPGHPNWIGFFLGATMVLGPYFWVRYRSPLARGVLLAGTGMEIIALVLANVRLGTAGFAIGTFWLVLRGAFRYRGLTLLLMAVGAVVAWPLLPESWKNRTFNAEYLKQDRSMRKRVSQFGENLRFARDHGVLGVGYGGYGYTYFMEAEGFAIDSQLTRSRVGEGEGEFTIQNLGAHVGYLEVLIEGGVIGLGLFLGMLVTALIGLMASVHRNKGDPAARQMGLVLEAALVSLAAMLVALHAQERRVLWVFVTLAAVYVSLTRAGLMAGPQRVGHGPR